MPKNVDDRRLEMLKLVYKDNKTPAQASRELAGKYDDKVETIQSDWSNRHQWGPELVGLDFEENQKLIADLLVEANAVKEELWDLYHTTDKDQVKLGVLKQIQNSLKERLDMLQSVGKAPKEPEKFEGKIEKDVRKLNLSWEKIEKELNLPGDKDDYIEAYEKATLKERSEEDGG